MPLRIRARLGSYEILEALGAGGMGEVYRARDTRLQRDVAISTYSHLLDEDVVLGKWTRCETMRAALAC